MGSVPVSIDPPVELLSLKSTTLAVYTAFSRREHVSSTWLVSAESCSYLFSVGNKLGELLTETKCRDDDAPVSFAVVGEQRPIFLLLNHFFL